MMLLIALHVFSTMALFALALNNILGIEQVAQTFDAEVTLIDAEHEAIEILNEVA